jgi:hypothetical protein
MLTTLFYCALLSLILHSDFLIDPRWFLPPSIPHDRLHKLCWAYGGRSWSKVRESGHML